MTETENKLIKILNDCMIPKEHEREYQEILTLAGVHQHVEYHGEKNGNHIFTCTTGKTKYPIVLNSNVIPFYEMAIKAVRDMEAGATLPQKASTQADKANIDIKSLLDRIGKMKDRPATPQAP